MTGKVTIPEEASPARKVDYPALPAGPLASAALTAAPAVSRTALLIHALQTMNHTRSAFAAAAIVAVCAAPVIWQESSIARTRAKLVRMEAERDRDGKKPPALSAAGPLPSPQVYVDSSSRGTKRSNTRWLAIARNDERAYSFTNFNFTFSPLSVFT